MLVGLSAELATTEDEGAKAEIEAMILVKQMLINDKFSIAYKQACLRRVTFIKVISISRHIKPFSFS